ncbi:23S rRNA (uracil(1939)-C(5))-methyltransferase RlmD [Bacteroidales bacterium OttesenSCG-928-I21]|nr:23S rRNA (uracil(1939)-C(5))-methyltransferase RlmD [Bacteroidales bacterium OttesenSCG-928-I21]
MRKKKYPVITNLEISDIAAEGVSIGRHENYVIFVRGTIPGDIVDVQLTRTRKSYAESKLLKINKFSEDRIEAFCKHFGKCGGCKWQMLPYEKQLYYKQKQVFDQLRRIGKINEGEMLPIIPSKKDKYYRNKLEFTFSNRRWLEANEPEMDKNGRELEGLGFHVQGMFDRIIDIENCYLQEAPSNEIRNKIRKYTKKEGFNYYNNRFHQGFMRNVIIRNSALGELMVVVIFAESKLELIEELMNYISIEFPQITSLQYIINTKFNDSIYDQEIILYKGKDHIIEELDGLKFKIGAKSFFQTNTEQALELYKKTLEFADIQPDEIVYDLYTGTGTIANFVASKCKKVVGVESVSEAIEDAKVNSQLNGIENTKFFVGDLKDLLSTEFIEQEGHPTTVILDPPRAGLHENVISVLKKTSPKKIVYVSCNPATQARDVAMLADIYMVEKIQPVDMFPHTHHVENIVLLKKK